MTALYFDTHHTTTYPEGSTEEKGEMEKENKTIVQ